MKEVKGWIKHQRLMTMILDRAFEKNLLITREDFEDAESQILEEATESQPKGGEKE